MPVARRYLISIVSDTIRLFPARSNAGIIMPAVSRLPEFTHGDNKAGTKELFSKKWNLVNIIHVFPEKIDATTASKRSTAPLYIIMIKMGLR